MREKGAVPYLNHTSEKGEIALYDTGIPEYGTRGVVLMSIRERADNQRGTRVKFTIEPVDHQLKKVLRPITTDWIRIPR